MIFEKESLGDVCKISSSKRIFAREYKSEGIPFYRGKEIIEKHNGNDISSELYISRERYEEIKAKYDVPKIGDILLTSVGTLGIPWLVSEENFYFKDGNLTWLRSNEKLIPHFLYWWLNSQEAKNQIDSMCIGSTQKALTIETLKKFKISLPNIEYQKKVIAILQSLQDKIETNTATNKNLEEQAQAIFKSWFIEAKNRDTWKTGTFSDIIESTLGGDWGKEYSVGNYTEKVYCVRGADIPEVRNGNKGKMPTRYILPKNFKLKRLVPNDIVVEISGGSPTQSTGRVAAISHSLLNRYDKGMVCTNFCRAIKPRLGYSMFVYYYWQYLYEKNVFFSYENGTTGIKNLDLNGFISTEEIMLPPNDLISKFDVICQTYFDEVFSRGLENEKLSELRDTLLPRLMSGEIDVSNIEI